MAQIPSWNGCPSEFEISRGGARSEKLDAPGLKLDFEELERQRCPVEGARPGGRLAR